MKRLLFAALCALGACCDPNAVHIYNLAPVAIDVIDADGNTLVADLPPNSAASVTVSGGGSSAASLTVLAAAGQGGAGAGVLTPAGGCSTDFVVRPEAQP